MALALCGLLTRKELPKKYTCEFNRDNGWTELGKTGYEPVRGVAIDEDWSALGFRDVQHIKKMARSFAMTEVGKKKISESKKQVTEFYLLRNLHRHWSSPFLLFLLNSNVLQQL